MSIYSLGGEGLGSRSSIFFINKYLDSPILDVPVKSILDKVRMTLLEGRVVHTQRRDRILNVVNQGVKGGWDAIVKKVGGVDNLTFNPGEYPAALRILHVDGAMASKISHRVMTVIAPLIGSSIRASGESLPDGDIIPEPPAPTINHIHWMARMLWWEQGVNQVEKDFASHGRGVVMVEFPSARGWTDGNVWVIRFPDPIGWKVLSHEQVLMMKDMVYSRSLVMIAASWLYPTSRMSTLVERLWRWQEECLLRHGNKGYDVAKSTEGLSKAYLARSAGDVMTGPGDGFTQMVEKVKAKERGLGTEGDFLTDRFAAILADTRDIQEVVELFGIQKCCGHPTIDPKKGGLSSAAEARSVDPTLWEDAEQTRASFMGIYTESFVAKNHRWPNFRSPPAEGTQLALLWRASSLRFKRQSVPLSDWVGVRFAQEHVLDTFPNYLDLMDDKALSFYWRDRACQWDNSRHPSSQRRVLLEMLARLKVSPGEIVGIVERGEIPDDWKVVTLYPKEREFKLNARMFSMMVFEMRLFFTLHEANLAESILPYVPQLTMTDSSKEIQLRFLSMTGAPKRGMLPLFLELDLSRWNLRWRAMVVERIGRDINDLFGTRRVFTTGHKFFEEARIMVRVSGLPPEGVESADPPESDLLWYNHKGGFEGIIQKLWSIATVAMVDRAFRQLEISYTLTIQGDNVVVSAHVPQLEGMTEKQSLDWWAATLTARASETAASVNQDLKPEECLASSSVVTYSKNVYANGSEYYTSLKFLSRLFPTSSEDFPSVASYVGAVFSGAVAAAERCKQPLVCLWVAYYSAALYMIRGSETWGCYHNHFNFDPVWREAAFIRYCLSLPSELGGFPTLGISNFAYKGSGDPLSKSLGSVWMCRDEGWAKDIISETYAPKFFDPEPQVGSLIKDPYGLPLAKPTSPADSVAEGTKVAIMQFARNADVRELVGATVDAFKEALEENLKAIVPFNPVIIRDIWDCSVAGVQDTIARMFVSTRSIQTVSRANSDVDLVSRVIVAGGRQLAYLTHRWRERQWGSTPPVLTLYEWITYCRSKWGPSGVTPVGVTSHLPIDFTTDYSFPPTANGIRVVGIYTGGSCLDSRGPEVPYLGTPTREKRSDHGFKLVGSSLSSIALRKLQLILSQTRGEGGLARLIGDVGLTRSSLDLTEVTHVLPRVIGGNPFHRYDARTGYRGAQLLGNANFASWLYLNSNNADPLSGAVEDYPLMVQEFFLYAMTLLERRYRFSPAIREGGMDAVTIVIPAGRLEPLPAGLLSIPDYRPLPLVYFPHNPLAFVGEQEVRQVSGPGEVERIMTIRRIDPAEHRSMDAALERLMADSLKGVRVGMATADPRYSYMSFHIDLLEVLGYGLNTVLTRFACLVGDLALAATWLAARGGTHAPPLGLIAAQVAPILARSIQSYVRHPRVLEDPAMMNLRLFGGPNYHAGSDLTSKITSRVTRRAAELLEDPDGIFYGRGVVLFDSDSPFIVLTSHTQLLLRGLQRLVLTGAVEPHIARRWALRYKRLSPVAANKTTRRETMAHLTAVLWRLHDEASGGGDHAVGLLFREVARSSNVRRCESSSQEIVRSARMRGLEREIGVRILTPDAALPSLIADSTITTTATVVGPYMYPPLLPMTYEQTLARDIQLHTGEAVMYGSSALLFWLRVSPYLPRAPTIVIGSGLGGTAASLALAGCPEVLGLDLARDIPGLCATGDPYVPPIVAELNLADSYHQLVETWYRGGDWNDHSVREKVLQNLPPGGVLVVDLHYDDTDPLTYINHAVISRRTDSTVVLRMMGRRRELDSRLLTLSLVWEEMTCLIAREWEGWVDAAVILKGKGRHRDYSLAVGDVYGRALAPGLPPRLITLVEGRDTLLDALLEAGGGQTATSEVESCRNYLAMCHELARSRTRHSSHHEWRRLMEGALGCCLLLGLLDLEATLETLRRRQAVRWRWGLWQGRTEWTKRAVRMVTHVTVRLLPLRG